MTWVGDDVSSGSLPSYVLASKTFTFDDQISSSILHQKRLVISVGDWYPLPMLVLNIDDSCLLIGELNLTEAVLTTASWQSSFQFCRRPDSTECFNHILRDQSVHSTEGTGGSSFSPLKRFLSVSKKQAVFYYKVVYSLSVYLLSYLYRWWGRPGFDWFGSDLDWGFFVSYEAFFNVLSVVIMCTGS